MMIRFFTAVLFSLVLNSCAKMEQHRAIPKAPAYVE